MSQDNTLIAEAINLPQIPATVLLPAQDLKAVLAEVRSLKKDFDDLCRDLKQFKVFTNTGKVDDLFDGLFDLENRVARLEERPAKIGNKTEKRMVKIALVLLSRGNEGLSFSEIGKILELGSRKGKACTREQNMTHFGKRLEEAKDRFVVGPNKTSGGKLVHLTKDYYEHLRREYVG
jgi:hypothetical protein